MSAEFKPRLIVPSKECLLLPTVTWPREMTPAKKHLVEISLDFVNKDGIRVWSQDMLEEKQYRYLTFLTGSDGIQSGRFNVYIPEGKEPDVEIYRSGAPSRQSEWVTIPNSEIKPGRHILGLDIINQWGVLVVSHDLPVTIKGTSSRQSPKRRITHRYR